MKKILITAIISYLTILNANAQEDITGTWWVNDKKAKVEISEENGNYTAKLIWLKRSTKPNGDPITDRNNPKKSLRNRELIGIEMIEDLEWKNGEWTGTIYSPEKGRYIEGTKIDLPSNDKLRITVSFWGQTRQKIWERADT